MEDRIHPLAELDDTSRYPLRGVVDDDPRFTFGLLEDLTRVLQDHDYPPVHGRDLVDLQQAIFRFIYRGDR